ncbi:MAG: capsule biosynthesis protein, partial [Hyphomicrobiaceae bacterium]|nr:capsule biosynthesis protein [Hyphomicrobiaceae bacterium]
MPTFVAAGYLYGAASDRYVSEAQFMVRGVSGRHIGGLAALFRTFGIARAEDDAFAVHSYMLSRDAVAALDAGIGLRQRFGNAKIDRLSRYPRLWRADTAESLHEFYQDRVSVIYNPSQGISTLRVTAWSAEDAQLIATKLLSLSENLINRMNQRANTDSLTNAEQERTRAEQLVIASQSEITDFRNRELVLDPTQASLKGLELIGRLSVELAQARAQQAETTAASPGSPGIRSLQIRIEALQQQI